MPALVKEYLHIVTAARWSSVEFPAHLHFTTHAIRAVGSEPGAAGKDHLLESCASQGWVLAQLKGAAHVFLHFTAQLILWGFSSAHCRLSTPGILCQCQCTEGQFLNTAQLEGAAHVETIAFLKFLRCLGFKDIRQQILISLTPRYIETQLVGNVHKVP